LVERQDLEALLLDVHLHLVDLRVLRDDLVGADRVPFQDGCHGLLDALLDPSGEPGEHLLELVDLPHEMERHTHPSQVVRPAGRGLPASPAARIIRTGP
jgi:hypothetical protein